MGCCASTNKHRPSSKFHRHSSRSSRAPPSVDVETVKEVLSETPTIYPFIKIEDDPKKNSSRHHSYKFRPQDHVLEDAIISEIGSTVSENISTTTFDDDNDNDAYRRKVINRSPATGSQNQASGELQPVRKSPVRGKEQSPGRVRMVPERNGRETGFGSSGRQRTGSGNISAARSRSPAKRMAAGGGGGNRNEIGRSLQDHVLEDPIISEIGSTLSENISTTTFDDDNDNDAYRRKVINRSPAKSGSRNQASGELQPVRKSPVRGKEQSPGRVRMVPERNGRETGFGSSGRQRTGSGNISAARSRSPAKCMAAGGGGGNRNEIGRSLSCRRTGKSPSRVGSDFHERVQKPELRSGREREHCSRFPTATNMDESLENPLVSLECFIFL